MAVFGTKGLCFAARESGLVYRLDTCPHANQCQYVKTNDGEFLDFVFEDAVTRWTVPHPRSGSAKNERLFRCWNCNNYRPSWWFIKEHPYDLTLFEYLVACYENHHVPWCRECDAQKWATWNKDIENRLSLF